MTSAHDATLKLFEARLLERENRNVCQEFTLFVSGASDLSARAIANARSLCELYLAGRYHLAVVDVHDKVDGAGDRPVLAVPTLIRHAPLPEVKLVGDLSHTARVLQALDLGPVDGLPAAPPEAHRGPAS